MAGSSAVARPHLLGGALAAFVGLSLANTLPPVAQLALYLVGLAAVLQRPHGVLPVREGALVLLAGVYVLVRRTAAGLELEWTMRLLRPCFEGYLLAHVLYKWCGIRDFKAAAAVLSGFVALQIVAALWMLLDPASRLAFIDRMYSDEGYQNERFTGALLFRGYGLSRHHLYGLPLAVGLSAALMLIAASIERPGWRRTWLAAVAGAALILVAVNARIGFVPVLLCYLAGASVFFDRYYPRHLFWLVLLLVLPLAAAGAAVLGDDFETLTTWLAAGYEQFGGDTDPEGSTFGELRTMLVLAPDAASLVLGGGRPCLTDEECYSDIGFMRAIQEGGLALLLLILAVYWRLNRHAVGLFRRTVGTSRRRHRRAALLLAVVVHGTLLAAMVKGEAYGASDYSRLVAALAGLGLLAHRPRAAHAVRGAVAAAVGPGAAVADPSPGTAA